MRITARALPVLLVLATWGCGGKQAAEESGPAPAPVVSVRVAPVTRRTVPLTLTLDGVTDVRDRETVVAPIDGTVVALPVEVGAAVAVGDTLAVLRARESEAAILGAGLLLRRARTPAQQEEARRAMQAARQAEQLVPVLARRPGIVGQRAVSAQQAVTAGMELLQVVDLSTLGFRADAPLADLPRLAPGQAARVRFPSLPDRAFDGKVASVSPQSNPGSQTVSVLIRFAAPGAQIARLLPVGTMGTATVVTGRLTDVLVVPRPALLRNDLTGATTIYTVGPDSLARAVPVTVEAATDSLAAVASAALRAGDLAIVKGNYEVSDSTRVTLAGGAP